MKKLMRQCAVAAAMTLGMSGVAGAGNHGDDCTLKTLRGTYIFAAGGFNIVAGVQQPKAIVEVIDFNSKGRGHE